MGRLVDVTRAQAGGGALGMLKPIEVAGILAEIEEEVEVAADVEVLKDGYLKKIMHEAFSVFMKISPLAQTQDSTHFPVACFCLTAMCPV
jgi:hypothetical protein